MLLIAKLRPKLEPVVEKQGLEWGDVVPALELVDSVEELEAAIADPEAFLQSLAHSMGPAAKKFLVAKLRPKLEPQLEKQGLQWSAMLSQSFDNILLSLLTLFEILTTEAVALLLRGMFLGV